MRLLVTGAAGFIGSHYVRSLLTNRDGVDGSQVSAVTVLDKLTYSGNRANLAPVADDPRLRFVVGDICDSSTTSCPVTTPSSTSPPSRTSTAPSPAPPRS
jgi:dTDP-glucose 4,6-dehydratase